MRNTAAVNGTGDDESTAKAVVRAPRSLLIVKHHIMPYLRVEWKLRAPRVRGPGCAVDVRRHAFSSSNHGVSRARLPQPRSGQTAVMNEDLRALMVCVVKRAKVHVSYSDNI